MFNFKVDEEDNDDLDFSDFEESDDDDNEENMCREKTNKKSDTLPVIDDVYLKCYARLIYNLKKLMEKNEDTSAECSIMSSVTADTFNSNNDQPLYCVKIINIFSQLSLFKPDYLSLINGDNQVIMKKIYVKIKKYFKILKDSVNCLFQVC